MNVETVKNVYLEPFAWGKYPDIIGGCYVNNIDSCQYLLHQRYSKKYGIASPRSCSRQMSGEYIYGGLLFDSHFGHLVAESVHRLWYCFDKPDCNIIFLCGKHTSATYRHIVEELMDIWQIKCRPIYIETPVVIESLIVPEPGKALGTPPAPEYIELLSDRQKSGVLFSDKSKPIDNIAILRDQLVTGALVGERYLKHILEATFHVFRPESFSLRDQMFQITRAKKVVISEGSSLHLYDLLGKVHQEVVVINRRKGSLL